MPTATTSGQYFNSNDKLPTWRENAASHLRTGDETLTRRGRDLLIDLPTPLPLTFDYTYYWATGSTYWVPINIYP